MYEGNITQEVNYYGGSYGNGGKSFIVRHKLDLPTKALDNIGEVIIHSKVNKGTMLNMNNISVKTEMNDVLDIDVRTSKISELTYIARTGFVMLNPVTKLRNSHYIAGHERVFAEYRDRILTFPELGCAFCGNVININDNTFHMCMAAIYKTKEEAEIHDNTPLFTCKPLSPKR